MGTPIRCCSRELLVGGRRLVRQRPYAVLSAAIGRMLASPILSRPAMVLPHRRCNCGPMTDRASISRPRPCIAAPAFPVGVVRRLRFRNGRFCPRCGHRRIHRWGSFQSKCGPPRQRYRCIRCGRTFSDFTGTPLAYLKRLDRWRQFCRIALGRLTVRGVAERVGIHRTTSFRWRHLLLARLRAIEVVDLRDRVSLDVGWLPFSAKGSRRLQRPARRRRFEGFSFETRVEWIVVACDHRRGSYATQVGPRRPRHEAIRAALEPALGAPTAIVCPRNRLIPFTPVASALDVPLELECPRYSNPPRDKEPERGRIYMVRVRRWLKRFRGVATRYLDHYLIWFRILGSVP